jgi:dipeptidyl aminopeptidase/acylaminoacyl peptidase
MFRLTTCALCFAFLCSTTVLANAAEPFTLDQVMSTPFASSLIANPAKASVAWIVNSRGRRNIWIAEAPDWKGRQITQFNEDDGQEIAELSWTPDGKAILFARGGDFEMGRENPNPTVELHRPEQAVWIVDANGGPAKRLAEGHAPCMSAAGTAIWFLRKGQVFSMKSDGSDVKSEFDIQGTATDLTWSPDGRQLAFTNERKGHSFAAIYSTAEKKIRFLDPSVDTDSNPVWSPDGSRMAFLRVPATTTTEFQPHREGDPWSIRVADAQTGRTTEVFRADPGRGSVFHEIAAEKQVMWTAGNRVVFPWEKTGWVHLYSIPVAGGSPVDLMPGNGIVEHAAINKDRKTICFSSNISDIDRRHIWTVNPDAYSKAQEITKGDGIEWEPTAVAGSNDVTFLASTYNSSAHAEVLHAGMVKPLAPEAVPADFPASQLIKPEAVLISSADGMQLHAQLFRPRGTGKHPALVFFHGGSRRQMLLGFHYMYYYSNAYEMNQYLASRGYLVLSVNYRSGIGYGLDFREALHYGAAGASEYNDVQGAGLYLRSREDVDPKRIGVWGGSYGGYLTALALARSSDLFAAGVDFHGVHDWNIEIPNFNPEYSPNAHPDFARIAFESSPLASVDTWKSPVLLIHGDDDRNVQFEQTIRLVEALRKQHVYFEELIFPNEIHDFLLWRDWAKAYGAAADFFERKLR